MADLHTHMIPGVDDGAPDLDSALENLQRLFDDGVTAVAATPHLNASDLNGKRRARADKHWPELVEQTRAVLPGLDLYRGFEIQLDTPQLDLSDAGLRLAGTRFALVEFHAFMIPKGSAHALARIRESGFVPILVHPERYWGYHRGYGMVEKWRSVGALLQLNAGSVVGEYGEPVQRVAHRFLSEGWIDFIASDNHARPQRCPTLGPVRDYLLERGLEGKAELLLSTNPFRILRDEMPHDVGSFEIGRGFLTRLVRAFMGGR